MKRTLFFLFLVTACRLVSGQELLTSTAQLRECDLLFHVTEDDSPITDATAHLANLKIDHVALYTLFNNIPSVVEAVQKGVVVTPLDSLDRKGYYLIGRVKGAVDRSVSIRRALSYVGRNYDFLFLPDNNDIYCSELVQLSVVDRQGRRVFQPIPMSFHDEQGRILPYWTAFYQQHNMDVPEGLAGTNPAELSQRKNVRIVYVWHQNANHK